MVKSVCNYPYVTVIELGIKPKKELVAPNTAHSGNHHMPPSQRDIATRSLQALGSTVRGFGKRRAGMPPG